MKQIYLNSDCNRWIFIQVLQRGIKEQVQLRKIVEASLWIWIVSTKAFSRQAIALYEDDFKIKIETGWIKQQNPNAQESLCIIILIHVYQNLPEVKHEIN